VSFRAIENSQAGLVVRQGRPGDLNAVIRIENAAFDDPWSRDALYSELLADRMRMPLVAELNGVACGYLMAWRVVDQLHILNIATDPGILRRGVGTALLMAAARLAGQGGQKEITLEVRRSNRAARQFYSHHHFVEMGVRPGYYQDNGEDAIIMTATVESLGAG
jgi:[ribosomal protein S18]-alanine N-acetyltransferase